MAVNTGCKSLEEFAGYKRLVDRQKFIGKYGYATALAPFILYIVLARWPFAESTNPVFVWLLFATLIWAFLLALYAMSLIVRALVLDVPHVSIALGMITSVGLADFQDNADFSLRSPTGVQNY
jgi:hypothetical protein